MPTYSVEVRPPTVYPKKTSCWNAEFPMPDTTTFPRTSGAVGQ